MKQLSSFMVISIDGSERVSLTYNEINPDSGELISANNKQSFYALDEELQTHIKAIQNYIKKSKLNEH